MKKNASFVHLKILRYGAISGESDKRPYSWLDSVKEAWKNGL